MKSKWYFILFIFVFGLMISPPVYAEDKTCVCSNGSSKFSINTDSSDSCTVICKAYNASWTGSTSGTESSSAGDLDTTTGARSETIDCGAFVEITKPIAQIIMIAAPILLLILGTLDFGKAVAASDEKAIKKATSDFVKRLLICIVILILPVLINMVMGWIKFQDLSACW